MAGAARILMFCGAAQVTGPAAPGMLAQLLQQLPPEAASEADQQHILARATQPALTST